MNLNKRGYTLIELVLVMFLLVLVAGLVFSLTAAGSQAWLRLTGSQDERSDLRTALSYLEVQIKKADEESAVSLEPDPFYGEQALRLDWIIENPTIPGHDRATTWIYLHDGQLYEFYTVPGMSLTNTRGRELVFLDNWQLEILSGNLLSITVTGTDGGSNNTESGKSPKNSSEGNIWTRSIYLRSGGLAQ